MTWEVLVVAGLFIDSFNAALPDLEASFGEEWSFKGTTYPAIAIDKSTDSNITMKGGEFDQSATLIYVRLAVFEEAGCKEGDIIGARGKEFAIHSINSDGDDSRELVCGPAQIDIWET